MKLENSETSDRHRLVLKVADKIGFKRSDKYVALYNISICYTWRNKKSHIKIINVTYQLQHGVKTLLYLTDHVL